MFAGRHFDREVILLCVRWYLRCKLSLRDLVEMMASHGLELAHTTIMRWVQRYVPEFEKELGSLCTQSWPLVAHRRDVSEGVRPMGLSLPCREQGTFSGA